ncbi:MAG: GIY-YIG nuclease family protein [Brevundimonas sp.]|uniref:GIY-YIG nuclease family protein n=1 Tax=Brevundimonas sp. TaxID=1871086 RepID=UPI0026330A12|nr:GIY-YIG nuclease family protein [Brevundimonas sp.]MDI6623542.1 GIY-YIG nuclease family protein [Brevundimonas sp.]MDQ7811940.1 GIY-YIG nuclease family protein [Brevundimonas sp.]
MTPQERKAAVAAYKERKTVAGVFAVICTATGEAWVGKSRHLDTEQNGLWFALRQGSSPFRTLQAAWNANPEADFRFEQLDRLPEDASPLLRDMELKERAGRWMARLGARALQ